MVYSSAFRILMAAVPEAELASLSDRVGGLPTGYVTFLRATNGADDALHQPDRIALRLFSAAESIKLNNGYQIQRYLPQLWMIGDDSGDYSYCFDRSVSNNANEWLIVEVPLGALFDAEIVKISSSFAEWERSLFAVPHYAAWDAKQKKSRL